MTKLITVMTYPLTGGRDFTIPFEYLARKFIRVTLLGANQRRELVLNTDYRFATKTIITTTETWSTGQYNRMEIRRYTSATDRLVNFYDGSILKAGDLNLSQIQTLHVAEEARDLTSNLLGLDFNGNFDTRNNRIINVADAVNPQDAVTLKQATMISENFFHPPKDFMADLSITSNKDTVLYLGFVYSASPAAIPFVTTATFNPAQWLVFSNVSKKEVTVGLHARTLSILGVVALRQTIGEFNGQRADLAYHTVVGYGAGMFTWDAASTVADDNGYTVGLATVGRWLRDDSGPTILAEAYGVIPDSNGTIGNGTDNTLMLQASLDKAGTIGWSGTGSTNSGYMGGRAVQLPAGKGCRITKTVRFSAYSGIVGSIKGGFGFNLSSAVSCHALVADFTNPLSWVAESDNFVSATGLPLAYNHFPNGTETDSGAVTFTHRTTNMGYTIVVPTGRRVIGGLKLASAPQSDVDISVFGAEIGIGHSSCWATTIVANTIHNKCGVGSFSDGNNVSVNGYLNRADATTASLPECSLMFDVFGDDTGLPNEYKDQVFGAYTNYALGSMSTNLVCEGNDHGHAVCNSSWDVNTFYVERTKVAALTGYSSGVSIGVITGGHNAGLWASGAGLSFSVKHNRGINTTTEHVLRHRYAVTSEVPASSSYVKGGIYLSPNGSRVYYVDSVKGNDRWTGLDSTLPVKSLGALLLRLSVVSDTHDTAMEHYAPFNATIVLSGTASHVITERPVLSCSNVVFESLAGQPTQQIIFDGGFLKLNSSNVLFLGCFIQRSGASLGNNEEGAIWVGGGANSISFNNCVVSIWSNFSLVYPLYNAGGTIVLALNATPVNAGAGASIIQSNYLNSSPHFITYTRTGGALTGGIETTASKGLNVPTEWILKSFNP